MAYDYYTFFNSSGMAKLSAVTSPSGSTLNTAQEAYPWPRLRVLGGWSAVWGPGAEKRVANVTVNASGSELVVHELRTNGAITAFRFYARETASGSAFVKTVTGSIMVSVPEGSYTDLILDPDGNVGSTTPPAAFNESSPPAGSAGILALIEAAKTAAEVP